MMQNVTKKKKKTHRISIHQPVVMAILKTNVVKGEKMTPTFDKEKNVAKMEVVFNDPGSGCKSPTLCVTGSM